MAQPTATLISGVVITVGINYWQIQISQKNREQDLEISRENNEEEILQKYLDGIEKLLLINNLDNGNDNNPARNIARFKTLTVLRRLTLKPEVHKTIILQFLYDANLIFIPEGRNRVSKLSLASCNFQKVNLYAVKLKKAYLNGVDFFRANFSNAILEEATLIGANLQEANLIQANLIQANLTRANLARANFSNATLLGANLFFADLVGADLFFADLVGADLKGATLYQANLYGANLYRTNSLDITQLKLAKNWEKAIYTPAQWDYGKFRLILKDEKANKAKIEEIRNLTEGTVTF